MVRPLLLKSVRVERSRDTHRPSACREASRLRSMRTEQWIRNHSKANLRLDMPFVQAEHAVHLRRQPLVMCRHQRRRAMIAHQADELIEHTVRSRLAEVDRRLDGEHEQGPENGG